MVPGPELGGRHFDERRVNGRLISRAPVFLSSGTSSVIRDVASQLSLRAVRTKRHGNPTERAHAAPPAHFMAKHVVFFHGHASRRHTVPAILLRTA